jgi:transposase-like protein
MFSEKRFRAQMIIAGVSHAELAKKLGINPSTLYRKIKNNGDFSRSEISKMVDILQIDNPKDIFFASELT